MMGNWVQLSPGVPSSNDVCAVLWKLEGRNSVVEYEADGRRAHFWLETLPKSTLGIFRADFKWIVGSRKVPMSGDELEIVLAHLQSFFEEIGTRLELD